MTEILHVQKWNTQDMAINVLLIGVGLLPIFRHEQHDVWQIQLSTKNFPQVHWVTPGCLPRNTRWNVVYGNVLSWIAMNLR